MPMSRKMEITNIYWRITLTLSSATNHKIPVVVFFHLHEEARIYWRGTKCTIVTIFTVNGQIKLKRLKKIIIKNHTVNLEREKYNFE
jgi:hypothetical protein